MIDQRFLQLLREDRRYAPEAYQFVAESLSYAQEVLGLGTESPASAEEPTEPGEKRVERHLSGQQLCEAIRQYAVRQYGYMAKVVLNSWGITSTSDFGEIVYSLIRIERMKRSKSDRREDFDDVYDFEEAFQRGYRITID
jgi:uncharacterized repeat protein (TIGR04138 family)